MTQAERLKVRAEEGTNREERRLVISLSTIYSSLRMEPGLTLLSDLPKSREGISLTVNDFDSPSLQFLTGIGAWQRHEPGGLSAASVSFALSARCSLQPTSDLLQILVEFQTF